MEYSKKNIGSFAGLDANLRPEMIKDEQASDIENLRFDKLGYLVNRNGTEAHPMRMSRTVYSDVQGWLSPIGAMGMTEYVLTKPWGVGSGESAVAPYDDATLQVIDADASSTDRLMVYAVRIPMNESPGKKTDPWNEAGTPTDHLTWRYKAAYLLSPLTGTAGWRDEFFFAPNGYPLSTGDPDNDLPSLYATVGTRSVMRADDRLIRTQIYAPVRTMGMHNEFAVDGVPKDQNWIEHYVSMSQYRESVTIADRTNGDMMLVDEYAEAEYSDTPKHRFSLRENTLAPFDIDDVVVDFGMNTGGFNDGVEAPLALYKFYLPRQRLKATRDNYEPFYTAGLKSPSLEKVAMSNPGFWMMPSKIGSFMATEAFFENGAMQVAGLSIDKVTRYSFTMSESGEEVDYLFGGLTLKNPDIKEDKQTSTDVYLWEDFKINYYPSSGLDQAAGNFLTAKDRTWDKTSSGGVKIIPLKTKKGVEQDVPLGVWRYRFVWYMGNGEYSAPSAELVVPDLLFSGLKDADITGAVGSYTRPFGIADQIDAMRTGLKLSDTAFINKHADAQGIKMFDGATVTEYGENFLRIKEALYDPDHEYAALESSTAGASWPTNWAAESILAKGQASVIATMYWSDDVATLQGVAVEAAYSEIGNYEDLATPRQLDYDNVIFKTYSSSAVQMLVPTFPKPGVGSHTYNSVFTSRGVIRTIYQNLEKFNGESWYSATTPAYQIVFEGTHRFGGRTNAEDDHVVSDVARNGKGVYFNVVCADVAEDNNNAPDDEVYLGNERAVYRNATIVRGTRSEGSRIHRMKSGLPAEVISRAAVSGIGEIDLCSYGENGSWISQIKREPTPYEDVLGYSDNRGFIVVNSTGWFEAPPGGDAFTYFDYDDFIRMDGLAAASGTIIFDNLQVAISAPGERLTIPEQLSMYVPASLLFGSPHIKLRIPANRIPRRARQLMVFRTRASHDNAWQPHEYGLVKSIDIERDPATGLPTGTQTSALQFLDDIKSEDLDFSYSVDSYDGFIKPIKSRFCLPLNERMFYANIVEAYKPQTPRGSVNISEYVGAGSEAEDHKNLNYGSNSELVKLWTNRLVSETTDTTNITKRYLYYFLTTNDAAKSYSLAAYSGALDRGSLATPANNKKRGMLYCLPSAYDASIEQANVYRYQTNTPLVETRFNASRTVAAGASGTVYLVVQGVVEYHGQIYYPKDIIVVQTNTDSGVPVGYANNLVNVFNGATTNRGSMGSYCDPIVVDITTAFDGAAGPDYIERIGTLVPEDEGVFYDNDLPSLGRLPLKQLAQNEDSLPAGLRWSAPYQPNKIQLASLMEVRSGDGDQITGMVQIYGNLVILKERSIHRIAVQGAEVPVSRVDEVSNNAGCIAPNTAIVVNNTLYFLSWAGFYRYNNNVLEKVDGAFAEELQVRLRSAQGGVSNPAIRDASCGWNPTYRELYLNIPVMTTESNEGTFAGADQDGITLTDNKGERSIRGVVYAIQIDTGLVTKYRYTDDSAYFTDPSSLTYVGFTPASQQRAPRTQGRLYYTNTLGQMRSAEILPARTYNYLPVSRPTQGNASMSYLSSLFFIESPTKDPSDLVDKQKDDTLVYVETSPGVYDQQLKSRYVHTYWRSKAWTAEDKTVLKRIRKVFTHISASAEPVVIRGTVHTSPNGPTAITDTQWEYTYADNRFVSPPYPGVTGELLAVPTEAAGASTSPSQNRGERHTFEVEGGGAFQMEYFGFYWKPVNEYER